MKKILLILLLIHLSGTSLIAQDRRERPNVLFIACDDMNDWVGFLGGHPDTRTPNMDRLAKRGMVFTRAYCASPICGPSRAAVLTGLSPMTTGVYNNQGTYVDYVPDAVVLPRFFKNQGYHVMGCGKINHAMGCVVKENYHEFGPDAGAIGGPFTWEELNMNPGTKVDRKDIAGVSNKIKSGIVKNVYPGKVISRGDLKAKLPLNGIDNRIDRPANGYNTFDWGPVSVKDDEMPDGKMAAWAVKKLQSQFDSPFFLAVGFYRPHQPWYAPAKYFEPFKGRQLALPPTHKRDLDDCPVVARHYARYPWSGSFKTVQKNNQWQDAIRGYLASIHFVDAQVGRVLDALDKSKYADNTIVVLWSDHGWELGEKEHWGKHSPWEGSMRVPLVIVPPKKWKMKSGKTAALASLLDLYPTLADMCQLKLHRQLDGKSLKPILTRQSKQVRQHLVTTLGRSTFCVRKDNLKLIHYYDGSQELYDLTKDPNEFHNLIKTQAPNGNSSDKADPRVAELKKLLPVDHRFQKFTRLGRYKGVLDGEGTLRVYDMLHPKSGIGEHTEIPAKKQPIKSQIKKHLNGNGNRYSKIKSGQSVSVFDVANQDLKKHRYKNFREPVVIRTEPGKIVVAIQAGNRLAWPERSGQDLVVKVSGDEGISWGPLVIAAEHGNHSCQCHGLVYDKEIRRLFLLYTTYNWDYKAVGNGRGQKATRPIYKQLTADKKPFVTSWIVSSDDDGATWSKPKDITQMVGRQAHFGASEGRQLTKGKHAGRLLIPGSRMTLNESGAIVAKSPGVWISDDHGKTWTLSTIPMGTKNKSPRNLSSEARVSELKDGTLIYNQRTRNTGRQLSWSRDGGKTWTPTQEHGSLRASQCNGCTLTVEDSMGKLTDTVLFSVPSPGGRKDGLVYASRDGGKSWPTVTQVVKGNFAYSALIQLDAEHVGLLYETGKYKKINFLHLTIPALVGDPK